MSEAEAHHRRILGQFAAAAGLASKAELLLSGGAMRIENYAVWFAYDAPFDPDHLFVYVDLDVPADPVGTYKRLLKLNFRLGAGLRGVMSLHPHNDHVIYAFRYPLVTASSGKDLLDTLLRFMGGISLNDVTIDEAATTSMSTGHSPTKIS
jgi:hypothetical protein